MPDLAYILRHPIQEARLAWRGRKPRTRPVVTRRMRWEWKFAFACERVARHILGDLPDDPYSPVDRYSELLSEDERGDLYGPMRNGNLLIFRPWRPLHIRAALRSRRERLLNIVEW